MLVLLFLFYLFLSFGFIWLYANINKLECDKDE